MPGEQDAVRVCTWMYLSSRTMDGSKGGFIAYMEVSTLNHRMD
ncbi:hypothetical protein [Thalassotalea mangrovi]|nr:hypothetical protein [Thalassotalea mangrovi]